ncbi:MAG: chemotaxis protein CheW [Deltaproteobacteria bacterium]|nr:chemotaxis protein CheW [Deltaproteobacteria bacterium]
MLTLFQVRETLNYTKEHIQSVAGKAFFLERQCLIMPIIPIANAFALAQDVLFNQTQLFVSVTSAHHYYTLQVDDVIGVQQKVLKKIDLLDFKQELFIGSALLGDGRLALVLGLDRLCRDFTQ